MELVAGFDAWQCDLCDAVYRFAYLENIPMPHLGVWKATLCMDCIRAVAAYDDGEEVGTGSEGMVMVEDE